MRIGVKTVVDGVKIAYEQCAHCGKSPSDKDIRAALEVAKRFCRSCVACGEPFQIVEVELYHHRERESEERWGSRSDLLEPGVDLEIDHGTIRTSIHLRCAKKVLPKLGIREWEQIEGRFSSSR